MKILRAWLAAATHERREQFCDAADTSLPTLFQVARGHRLMSAARAATLEAVAKKLGIPLRRGDMAKVCGECPYYRKVVDQETIL